MTEFVTERPIVAPVLSHRPWWRGKPVQVALVAAGMWVAYRSLRLEYPWPDSLAWNSLQFKLDEFQVWLIEQRSAEDKSLDLHDLRRVPRLRGRARRLVHGAPLWLTWVGTTVAGTLLVWRFGGRRAAAIDARRLRDLRALRALGGEHGDARADARRGRACRSSSGSRSGSRSAARAASSASSGPSSTQRRSSPPSPT